MALDQVDVDKLESRDPNKMSFLEHLEALRWHIIRSFIGIVLIGIVVFLMKDFVFQTVILGPKNADFITYQLICDFSQRLCFYPPEFQLLTRDLGEQFIVHLKVSFFLALILSIPYVFFEVWRFIKPGLYEKERKAARGFVFICSTLFFIGVLFGYYIISPFAITFLASYDVGAVSAPTLNSYVNYMTMFTLPTGIVFQLPVVVYFLASIGLIGPSVMRQYRKHAFVGILVLASVITPPDVITQLLISGPLYFLYEVSIVIAARIEKRNKE
nr:twin-arginine translocase subunit TatC [Saprospiraceae bacterium]